MNFGLSSHDFATLRACVVAPLQQAGATVWLFGSRARGDHKKFSDIDLLYSFAGGHEPRGLLSELKENAEVSRLPYRVDLVCREELAESYKEGVERDKILL